MNDEDEESGEPFDGDVDDPAAEAADAARAIVLDAFGGNRGAAERLIAGDSSLE